MTVFYINKQDYVLEKDYIMACRDNVIYELFCYINSEGSIRKIYY